MRQGVAVESKIEACPKSKNPNALQLLRNTQSLREYLKDDNGESFIIRDFGDWILTFKAGPYSDRDCMLLYAGDNESVKSFCDCSIAERAHFRKILSVITQGVETHYHQELLEKKLTFVIGVNFSMVPGAGKAQSVFRPHIHISLFDLTPGTRNFIENTEGTVGDYKGSLGLSLENKTLLSLFEKHSSFFSHSDTGIPALFLDGEHYALDFELPDSTQMAGAVNSVALYNIYSAVSKFLHGVDLSLGSEFGMMKKYSHIPFNAENLAFSLGVFRNNNKNFARLKFLYKSGANSGGVMESLGIIISRSLVDSPRFPDMSEFRDVILRIVG